MDDLSFYAKAAAYLAAGIAVGIGTIGAGIGQGLIGKEACKSIGKYPESQSQIRTTMFLALGIVESCAIYAFLIALLLIFLS